MAEWHAAWQGTERVAAPSLDDRGLAYGDGLFETMRAHRGGLPWWPRHRARLQRGALRIGLDLPAPERIEAALEQALAATADGVVKLILTRGSGARGYAPPEPARPLLLLRSGPAPAALKVPLAVDLLDFRLGLQPALAGLKHLNRLEQVLAAAEARRRGLDEGLLALTGGGLVCATRANLFVRIDGRWITPPLEQAGVAGIAREILLESWPGLAVGELPLAEWPRIEGLFLANAMRGILPVARLGDRDLDPQWDSVATARALLAATQPAFRED